jgi:hypothetical protein
MCGNLTAPEGGCIQESKHDAPMPQACGLGSSQGGGDGPWEDAGDVGGNPCLHG